MKYKFRKPAPFKHQRVALVRAIRQGYIGLLMEPGTSKTRVIIDWSCALHMAKGLKRVLVVAPLSVVGVWEDEFKLWATVPYRLFIMDKDTERIPRSRTKLTICVVNYDLTWRRKDIIYDYNPQMVVADESHRIKRASTRRSRFLRTLNRAPYRAILTGTPTPKSFLDIYGQWVFLNSETFGTEIKEFKRRYILMGGYMQNQVKGYTNVDELKKKIRADAIIRRKDQCLDLPDKIFQRIPVQLEANARDLYDRMEEELFLQLTEEEEVDAANVAVKILRLQQITGGYLKSKQGNLHILSEAKLKVTEDLLSDLVEEGRKVVVFARFLPELDALTSVVTDKLRVPCYVIRGGVPRNRRDEMRREFQSATGPRVFLSQIASGGLGISLHASHDCLFYSVSYALDDFLQAQDRLHRPGQTNRVTYRTLVATNTIDLDVYAALRAKEDILRTIMGSPKAWAKKAISRRRRSKS